MVLIERRIPKSISLCFLANLLSTSSASVEDLHLFGACFSVELESFLAVDPRLVPATEMIMRKSVK